MPGNRAHKIGDHHALPPSGSLSEAQFGQLIALLDDQHQALVTLLEPIQEVAKLLLAEREQRPADPAPNPQPDSDVSGPDDDGPGNES